MFIKVTKKNNIRNGKVKSFKINGKRISIANIDDRFFAFDDTCTHEKCSLSKGELEGRQIVCPCHGARFDVESGQALSLPAVKDLTAYEIKIKGENILVKIK